MVVKIPVSLDSLAERHFKPGEFYCQFRENKKRITDIEGRDKNFYTQSQNQPYQPK